MVDIVQHLLQYVPFKQYERSVLVQSMNKFVTLQGATCCKILFVGDQLTVARARGAIRAMANAVNPIKRLEGLIPVVEDWHAKVIILEV